MTRSTGSPFLPSFLPHALLFAAVAASPTAQAGVLDRDPATTHAQRIAFIGRTAAADLQATVVGRGIAGTSVAAAVFPMGEVTWVLIAQKPDDLGMRHAYYRQILRPTSALAAAIDPTYVAEGLEVAGGMVSVHSDSAGVRSVFGAQHREVEMPLVPAIGRTFEAFELAQDAVALHPGFRPASWRAWPAETIASLRGRTSAFLATTGETGRFRLIWRVPTYDADGVPHVIALDGTNGALLAVNAQVVSGQCVHSDGTPASAIGYPEHDFGQPTRALGATWIEAYEDPEFTHEGMWPQPGAGLPRIKLWIGTTGADPNPAEQKYNCHDTPAPHNKHYGVFPVHSVGGQATYDRFESPTGFWVEGEVAADAMHFSRVTMASLLTWFGYHSYDGNGSDLEIVVADGSYSRTSAWNQFASTYPGDNYHPAKSVSIYRRGTNPWHASAALDSVAHEWGHGVTFNKNPTWNIQNYGYCDSIVGQMAEGFADVIGHFVERLNQPGCPPSGLNYECGDWLFMEDATRNEPSDPPYRRVDCDDAPAEYKFHRQDTTPSSFCYNPDHGWTTEESHQMGNQMAVAFRLVADGGRNPACLQISGCNTHAWSGCDRNVAALGLVGAGKIFFRVLTVYATDVTDWWTLSDLAKSAAFDIYGHCVPGGYGYDAHAEQVSVEDSFFAIGYHGITGYHTCPY